jgi:hypothetical protein
VLVLEKDCNFPRSKTPHSDCKMSVRFLLKFMAWARTVTIEYMKQQFKS